MLGQTGYVPISRLPSRESLSKTWARRFFTLPLYLVLWLVLCVSLPLTLPVLVVFDLARRQRFALVRSLVFFVAYLTCEVAGIVASFAVWVGAGTWSGLGQQRFRTWNFALERAWARTLMGTAKRVFGMKIVLENDILPTAGPLLVLSRHVSIGDTLLPSLLLSDRFGIDLRYVLKRELLWDPCLDIVGNRLPNYFARRGSGEGAREIAAVQGLMDDLGSGEGVLIYPEGTRFTQAKRGAILDKLRQAGNAEMYERALRLPNLLPPRLGGVMGLLERNRGADVVFMAHVGFEGSMDFAELMQGCLIGRVVRVGMWSIPYADVPLGREQRIDWLYQQWQRMDEWVATHSHRAGVEV